MSIRLPYFCYIHVCTLLSDLLKINIPVDSMQLVYAVILFLLQELTHFQISGVYLPAKGRYLMYSDSGVWEICRHVFQPDFINVTENNVTVTQAPKQQKDISGLKGNIFISKLNCFFKLTA